MQASLESTGTIGRKLTVTIPAERVETMVSERLGDVGRNLNLPGFRRGHVPRKLVEARYAGRVLAEVAEELIDASYREALGKEDVNPVGPPRIEAGKLERGADLEYVAEFDVYPRIVRTDLQGETIERPVCEVAEEDVDRTIESLRERRVEWDETADAASLGDRVVVDSVATIDGKPVDGGKNKNFGIVLGEEGPFPGLEKGLEGARVGDAKTIDVNLPDFYPDGFGGKTAKFEVAVRQVCHPRLPVVDEAFVKAHGIEDGAVETLRAEVRASLQGELQDRMRADLRHRVMQRILELNPIEVPAYLVDVEVGVMVEAMKRLAPRRARDVDREEMAPEARRRVTLALIMREVARVHGIRPDEERVRRRVEELAADYEDSEEFVRWYYADRSRLEEVEGVTMEEQFVECLSSTARIEDRPVTFRELVDGKADARGLAALNHGL